MLPQLPHFKSQTADYTRRRARVAYTHNAPKILARIKQYKSKNPDRRRDWDKTRYEKYKNYERENAIKKHAKLRQELLIILGGPRCVSCGYDKDVRALQFDHIKGFGMDDRRRYGSHDRMIRAYVVNPALARKELQILCANCNWIKRQENKEFSGTFSMYKITK